MAPAEVKAWYFEQFGDPAETFKFGTVVLPEIDAGDVLVKVKAAGLNPVDKMIYRGQMYPDKVKFPVSLIPSMILFNFLCVFTFFY